MKSIKNILKSTFILLVTISSFALTACRNTGNDNKSQEEDINAKKNLQGTWINDIDGNILFSIKGDTIYYNDSLSSPVAFYVQHDSLIIQSHKQVRYSIKKLNSTQFTFINADGDDVELIKDESGTNVLAKGEYRGAVNINQGKKVKNDSIVTVDGKHLHAYTQINPTTYKVYHQSTNSDGLTIESVYFDNLVYITLYDGARKVFGQNIEKSSFNKLVPESYLEQAVLSEIKIHGSVAGAVRFIAILSVPETYTNYRVNIDVTPDGKTNFSI